MFNTCLPLAVVYTSGTLHVLPQAGHTKCFLVGSIQVGQGLAYPEMTGGS